MNFQSQIKGDATSRNPIFLYAPVSFTNWELGRSGGEVEMGWGFCQWEE